LGTLLLSLCVAFEDDLHEGHIVGDSDDTEEVKLITKEYRFCLTKLIQSSSDMARLGTGGHQREQPSRSRFVDDGAVDLDDDSDSLF
jgi:hypothetical protein